MFSFRILILVLLVLTCYVGMHETVHYQINNIYDCKVNEFHLSWKGPGILSVCKVNDSHKLAHSINEIVGYTLSLPLMLWFCFKMKEGCEKY